MHLLVLSAFRPLIVEPAMPPIVRLNAPFGAQCFPTDIISYYASRLQEVSMHLLVLSAFRPGRR